MSNKTEIDKLAEMTGAMTELAFAEQVIGLKLLLAEMQALTTLLPGATVAGSGETPDSARDDEQIESNFDNMPI